MRETAQTGKELIEDRGGHVPLRLVPGPLYAGAAGQVAPRRGFKINLGKAVYVRQDLHAAAPDYDIQPRPGRKPQFLRGLGWQRYEVVINCFSL